MKTKLIPHILWGFIMMANACSDNKFTGFSYDPEGAAITTNKVIENQKKRSFGSLEHELWISNEFAGARLNNVYVSDASAFRVEIKPERQPVNNSPWFAFKLWGHRSEPFHLHLVYQGGKHRYHPKISTDRQNWRPIDNHNIQIDSSSAVLTLHLPDNSDTLWIAAQEILTSGHRTTWIETVANSDFVQVDTAGHSVQGRPIHHLRITDPDAFVQQKGVVIVTGRQHPPEVPGDLAMETFTETFLQDSTVSREFLKRFEVHLFPMLNPDGVDAGHWRLNANGVDLNRDWEAFNQPETKAVREALLPLKTNPYRKVYYSIDFHATDEHVLYPILPEIEKFPGNITQQWIKKIKAKVPEYPFRSEPYDTTAPIAKNWIYKTFGSDGVTFELYDETDRNVIKRLSRISSRQLMELLNDAHRRQVKETDR